MKKLDEIPKNNPFKTPDGYFDKLPGIIQSRIEAQQKPVGMPYLRLALKFALPSVMIAVALFFALQNNDLKGEDAETLLAAVSTEELAVYLEEEEFSTDELLENINVDYIDIDQLNEGVIINSEMNDDDLDQLQDEFQFEYF